MSEIKNINDFTSLLLQNTPLIDVRAPVEFSEGSIPGSVNLPLMNNLERHQVGLMYKAQGQEAAIKLGHQLVSGEVKAKRLKSWIEFVKQEPSAVLYCYRGGLRSKTTQQWLREAGVDVPLIEGGFKAVRRFLIETINTTVPKLNFKIVGGSTGSGKTEFVSKQKHFIDLEKLAHHRGSAFGGFANSPQPSQVDFENRLALEILKLRDVTETIFLEGESRMIGRCALPELLYKKMLESPRLEHNLPLEERVNRIYQEYVLESPIGAQKDESHFNSLENSLNAISKKLGGLRHQELLNDLANSRREFSSTGDLQSNKIWIRKLLQWYYDPLYEHARIRSLPKQN